MKKAPEVSARVVKQVPLDLPLDFVLMLDAYCDAMRGLPRARVIRDAVTELIKRDLDENPGIQHRFLEAEQRLRKERFTVVDKPTPIKRPRGED